MFLEFSLGTWRPEAKLQIFMSVITVFSLLIAVFQTYRAERIKDRERSNAAVLEGRIAAAFGALEGVTATVDSIVQLSKKHGISTGELQNIARIARIQTITTAKQLRDSQAPLRTWRIGSDLQQLKRQGGGAARSAEEDPPEETDRQPSNL